MRRRLRIWKPRTGGFHWSVFTGILADDYRSELNAVGVKERAKQKAMTEDYYDEESRYYCDGGVCFACSV